MFRKFKKTRKIFFFSSRIDVDLIVRYVFEIKPEETLLLNLILFETNARRKKNFFSSFSKKN